MNYNLAKSMLVPAILPNLDWKIGDLLGLFNKICVNSPRVEVLVGLIPLFHWTVRGEPTFCSFWLASKPVQVDGAVMVSKIFSLFAMFCIKAFSWLLQNALVLGRMHVISPLANVFLATYLSHTCRSREILSKWRPQAVEGLNLSGF